MRRRDFIKAVAGSALACPLAGHAQQAAMPVIGFLNGQTAAGFKHLVTAFLQGLNEAGFVEGRNVAIEYRWADGNPGRLRGLADGLVDRGVVAIVATGASGRAAKAATTTIPIVSTFGGDPVKLGFVESLNRPGGNITGATVLTSDLEAKRFELLHELLPKTATAGVLLDRQFSDFENQLRTVESAARTLDRKVHFAFANSDAELDQAFASFTEMRVAGAVVVGNPFFNNRRERLLMLSHRHRIPAIYESREFTVADGLMSYGTNVPDVYRQIGVYAGRILNGEKPADLPVVQPAKFDIAINLKTAKALGLDVPTSILLRSDEVIE